jgi:hypothetical protein
VDGIVAMTAVAAVVAQSALEAALAEERQRDTLRGFACIIAIVCFAGALLWAIICSATRPAEAAGPRKPAPPPQRPAGYVGSQVLDMPRGVYAPDPSDVDSEPAPPAPASGNYGPGKYRVGGVDRESKMDTWIVVNAESATNAKVKGELEGIVVTKVEYQGRP